MYKNALDIFNLVLPIFFIFIFLILFLEFFFRILEN